MKNKSFDIIPINFRLKCLMDIEAAIQIPDKGFFVRNENSIRLSYSVDKQIKYINLPTHEAAADFLTKRGIIHGYAIIKDEVKMYCKTLITIEGPKGQPVQMERLLPVKWEEIHLNAAQVQSFAALHELEMKSRTMGLVVNMITDYLKTA
jgi:hypothetical protein